MKPVQIGVNLFLIMMLCACDQASAPPDRVDSAAAAQAWAATGHSWSDDELYVLEKGRALYRKQCAACHLLSGQGQQSFGAPALRGGAVANGPIDTLVATVLDGRNSMPAFREALDDDDLAAILSYVRNAWGNNTGEIVERTAVGALRPAEGAGGR